MSLNLPEEMISLYSDEGNKMFIETLSKEDGYGRNALKVLNNMETQKNFAFCGIASCVTVLNALLSNDFKPELGPYRHFNQENFFTFNKEALKFTDDKQVSSRGMRFTELVNVLTCQNGVSVQSHSKEEIEKQGGLNHFREICKKAFQTKDNFPIIYYSRDKVKQEGRGHISPLAAYHEEKDMILLLDVSRFKYEPAWINTKLLYDSLLETDPILQQSGGIVIVSKNTDSQPKPNYRKTNSPNPIRIFLGLLGGSLIIGSIAGFFVGRYLK
ncbi:hypothetical protein ABK040_008862 [Willaertia magna]